MLRTIPGLAPQLAGTEVCCDVTAFAVVQATADELDAVRKKPALLAEAALSAALLKQADYQTLAGLLALSQAIQSHRLDPASLTNWGVLGAPRLPGRAFMVAAVQRFAADGAWGVSPHIIPHSSLHALSGAISQALKIHGPNLGVGGFPGGETEALLAAAAFLADNLPGVWLVLTGWDPEPIPGQEAPVSATPLCRAVALALVAAQPGWNGSQLRIRPAAAAQPHGRRSRSDTAPAFCLESLCAALIAPGQGPTRRSWRLGSDGWLELDLSSNATEGQA